MRNGILLNLVNKPERLFLIYGFIFGFLFLVSTAPFSVRDEFGNIQRAIDVARGNFWNKTPYHVHSKADDMDKLMSAFRKKIVVPKKNGKTEGIKQIKPNAQNGYSPVMYLAPALGIKIGYLCKSAVSMFYLARLFNLFVWLALIYTAIRITPICKWYFCIFALLPKFVYQGMSASCDSFVNAFGFLFFACMFKLIFEAKEELSKREISIYAIFTLISAFLKGCLIWPAFLLIFVKDKRKFIYGAVIIIICGLLGSLWIFNNYISSYPGTNIAHNKYLLLHSPYLLIHF